MKNRTFQFLSFSICILLHLPVSADYLSPFVMSTPVECNGALLLLHSDGSITPLDPDTSQKHILHFALINQHKLVATARPLIKHIFEYYYDPSLLTNRSQPTHLIFMIFLTALQINKHVNICKENRFIAYLTGALNLNSYCEVCHFCTQYTAITTKTPEASEGSENKKLLVQKTIAEIIQRKRVTLRNLKVLQQNISPESKKIFNSLPLQFVTASKGNRTPVVASYHKSPFNFM